MIALAKRDLLRGCTFHLRSSDATFYEILAPLRRVYDNFLPWSKNKESRAAEILIYEIRIRAGCASRSAVGSSKPTLSTALGAEVEHNNTAELDREELGAFNSVCGASNVSLRPM